MRREAPRIPAGRDSRRHFLRRGLTVMNQEKFVQSLFDERAPAYDSWVSGFWTAYRESVDRETARVLSETGSPVSVIDVGCGTASRLNRFLDAEPAGKFLRPVALD